MQPVAAGGSALAEVGSAPEDRPVGDAGREDGGVMLDLVHTKAVLGVADDTIGGWVEGDLAMLESYLAEHDTGQMTLGEVARQGLLEAFVVAVCLGLGSRV